MAKGNVKVKPTKTQKLATKKIKARTRQKLRSAKLRERRVNREFYSDNLSLILGGVSLFFGLLLVALLIRFLSSSDVVPSFSSLLSMLSNAPTLEIPFLSQVTTNFGDWGIFNFLRDFIKFFASILDVLVFIFTGLANLVLYVVYFMRWLFIF